MLRQAKFRRSGDTRDSGDLAEILRDPEQVQPENHEKERYFDVSAGKPELVGHLDEDEKYGATWPRINHEATRLGQESRFPLGIREAPRAPPG